MKKNKKIIANAVMAGALALQSTLSNAQTETGTTFSLDESVRSFQVHIPQEKIDDLKKRILTTQWPDQELVEDESQGVQLATMKALAAYWATKYDWRKIESKLNSYPQFITNIDGLDIHFIHVRSKHKDAMPVIITHGWPGSIIEQLKIIGPLTDPTAYGGKAEDAFDVVIPSLLGHGFSAKATELGWNPVRVAKAWIELMKRLGYKKFVAQGGDWGNAISESMALIAPPELLGIHTNMAAAEPAEISKALAAGTMPDGLSDDEKKAYKQLDFFNKKGLAYAQEMGLRPQTLYGIADSPIGLAAWMLDHDDASYKLITRIFNGETEGLSKDDILDNISLYWFTNTGVSSARLYWEATQASTGGGFFDPRNVQIPVAVSSFPDEIYAVPKPWAEKAYPKLIFFNKHNKGGHFAAWEQPQLLTEDLRAAFKTLR
ncbi:epoxide hydrolase family protein [Parafilimonas terrae]|uniref:Pimeloyl-ACP methyl ester carboxylesterase n=1 Tax=Parafilimonas terrae TaxID=1465490 RepID=A0A1I5Y1P2_9BACT|nr:epoxide hydrolase [Parafilimonas terrae]SFQ38098.1 Pimeloyl-ACP methyl ester carboxylesterase [Parafilimonas terrae]